MAHRQFALVDFAVDVTAPLFSRRPLERAPRGVAQERTQGLTQFAATSLRQLDRPVVGGPGRPRQPSLKPGGAVAGDDVESRLGVGLPAGAAPMMGTSSSIALWTAVPIDPEELSTDSSAGEMRSSRLTAPSAASTGSLRATLLISLTASLTGWTAGWDRHPRACRWCWGTRSFKKG